MGKVKVYGQVFILGIVAILSLWTKCFCTSIGLMVAILIVTACIIANHFWLLKSVDETQKNLVVTIELIMDAAFVILFRLITFVIN